MTDPFAGRTFVPGDDPLSPAFLSSYLPLEAIWVVPAALIARRMGRAIWFGLLGIHPFGILPFLYLMGFRPSRLAKVTA